jgi:hypothetical protein
LIFDLRLPEIQCFEIFRFVKSILGYNFSEVIIMLETVWAVVQNGKVETTEAVNAPNGTRALVTLLVEDEVDFWQAASSQSLDEIWDNEEDDVYAELLEK